MPTTKLPSADIDLTTGAPLAGQTAAVGDNTTKLATTAFVQYVGQNNTATYATATGTGSAYVVTLAPVPAAYQAGMPVIFKANISNTGACTVNVNGLGAVNITKTYNTALAANDILANQIVQLIYDGVEFQLTTVPSAGGLAGTMVGNILFAENTELQLDASLSADGKYCGITEAGTAGENIVFGDLVYFKSADSRWWKTAAGADATSGNVRIGMVVLAASAAGATNILTYGKIRADTQFSVETFAYGSSVYVSETSGISTTFQATTPNAIIRKIGFAYATKTLLFNPSNDYITHI